MIKHILGRLCSTENRTTVSKMCVRSKHVHIYVRAEKLRQFSSPATPQFEQSSAGYHQLPPAIAETLVAGGRRQFHWRSPAPPAFTGSTGIHQLHHIPRQCHQGKPPVTCHGNLLYFLFGQCLLSSVAPPGH